mmetsp:Transcript_40898/g.95974  ORF Transcript_40898/g.95974 Transcript_40898/m.95974 type:complete len:394 (+) Transcript_40898:134-1315(+)
MQNVLYTFFPSHERRLFLTVPQLGRPGHHDVATDPADFLGQQPVGFPIMQRLAKERNHIDEDVVVYRNHILQKLPGLGRQSLRSGEIDDIRQHLRVHHRRVQIRQKGQKRLGHGMHPKLLRKLRAGIEALPYLPHLRGEPRQEKDVPFGDALLVDGVHDPPQLLGHAEGSGAEGVGFLGAHGGVEGDGPYGIGVGDEFLEGHAEAAAGVGGSDGDVEIASVFEVEDEDVLEDVLGAVEGLGDGVVDGDGDFEGGALVGEEHAEGFVDGDPGFAEAGFFEFGQKAVMGHNLSGVGESYGDGDAFVVAYFAVVQTRFVEGDDGERVVFKFVQHLHDLIVDVSSNLMVDVLGSDFESGHDRFVVGEGEFRANIVELTDMLRLLGPPEDAIAPGGRP